MTERERETIEVSLVCPGCHEYNRPGIRYIELAASAQTAHCTVCSVTRPLAAFMPSAAAAPIQGAALRS